MKKFLIFSLVAVSIIAPSLTLFQSNVSAADARNFNPGRIIDDGIFTNSDAMSVGAIQNFLNSKVTSCDTWGSKPSELGGGTRAQWLAANGYSTPVTCLRDYYENSGNGQSNYGGSIPAGAISAAQIIYNYSKQFNINPQVLLVTLQKENGLITDEWPTPKQYREAMGFGCPDNTAPGAPACDPSYGSFSAQIYQAARHFRGYIDKPAGWFVPFTTGNNSIAYHPNASCGRSIVNIENRSTVALYSYTPYRPSDASLNAQYGTGDNCSAHGNRNFYLYFTDWFGSTIMNGTFLRTVNNSTLYLVSGNSKYPISDVNIFYALYPLGNVGYVAQSYLDTKTTGSTLGRVIRSSGGTVYFYDAGIKLSFGSCAQVEAYGSSCGQAVLLEDYQINSLQTGPGMTNIFGTTTGKRFYIEGGLKREVYDDGSLSQAGLNEGMNVLNESALANLTYGVPVIRDNVFIRERSSNSLHTHSSGTAVSPVNTQLQGSYINGMNLPKLDTASIGKLSSAGSVSGYLQALDGSRYIIVGNGKIKVTSPDDWSSSYSVLSDGLLNQIPTVDTVASPYTVKSNDAGTIYLLSDKVKRAIASWDDLLLLSPSPKVLSLPDYYMNTTGQGAQILSPGGLVRTVGNSTVYMIDGLGSKIAITSFSPSSELGFNTLYTVPDAMLASYGTAGAQLSAAVRCGSKEGLAIGGAVYELGLPLTYIDLSDLTCKRLNWKPAVSFFTAPNGTIYKLESSQKRPIGSYETYLSAGGNASNTIRASNYALGYMTTGSPL